MQRRNSMTAEAMREGIRNRHEEQMRLGLSKNIRGVDMHLSRQFAGGHVFTEGLLVKLLSEAYYNPRVPSLITSLLGGGGTGTPQLQLVPVPVEMRGQKFGHLLVSWLRSEATLCLGLLRVARDEHNQPMDYVVCKPPSETTVVASDRVFVLAYAGEHDADAGASAEWQ
jgi:hypothetical protein